MDRAQKEMPGRLTAQLRWAVAFAQLDLEELSSAERESLGYGLRVLILSDSSYRVTVGPLADQKIRTIHATLRKAIQTYLAGEHFCLSLRKGGFFLYANGGGQWADHSSIGRGVTEGQWWRGLGNYSLSVLITAPIRWPECSGSPPSA